MEFLSVPGLLLDTGTPTEGEVGSVPEEHRCRGGDEASPGLTGTVDAKLEGWEPSAPQQPVQVWMLVLGLGSGRKP